MIILNNCKIEFSGGGLFLTDDIWIHPQRCETTYEIIYVIAGDVFISEENTNYHLKNGDLIILKPGKQHFGFKESSGRTSFHWLHFVCDNFSSLPIKQSVFRNFKRSYLFKEILHHYTTKNLICCEASLTYLLSELFYTSSSNISKLCADVVAWVRINANASCKVKDVANRFDYNSEHLSRLIKKNFGCNLKQLIDREIVYAANNLLLNSNLSIKEIATALHFPDSNSFVHFYKYHKNISPSNYRNNYSNTKINKI